MKTEENCIIFTTVLLHQHRWGVAKWYISWKEEHVQKFAEALIYTQTKKIMYTYLYDNARRPALL